MIGVAHQEKVSGDGVAQQGRSDFCGVDEIHVARADFRRDRFFQLAAGQTEFRVARKCAGDDFIGIDDGLSAERQGFRAFRIARYQQIAADHQIGAGSRDFGGLDVFGLQPDAHIAQHRAAFLRQAGHFHHATAQALQVSGHADDRADRDRTLAADAGDE